MMEFEEILEQNEKLIWWVIHNKFPGINWDKCGYTQEDIKQVCMIGLWKAHSKYDESKGTWANFAVFILMNEVRMLMRTNKKWKPSTYDYIDSDDFYFDPVDESSPYDHIIEADNIKDMVRKLWPRLSLTEKMLMQHILNNTLLTDRERGVILGRSRTYVTKIKNDIRAKHKKPARQRHKNVI